MEFGSPKPNLGDPSSPISALRKSGIDTKE
jgi:hypothetical protein